MLDAFLRAWQACDIPALAALLREDVMLTMPPQAIQITGRHLVAEFFATVPAKGWLDLIEMVATRANGHPSLAAYLPDGSTSDCHGYGIMVITVADGQIATITGFPDPAHVGRQVARLAARLGLDHALVTEAVTDEVSRAWAPRDGSSPSVRSRRSGRI